MCPRAWSASSAANSARQSMVPLTRIGKAWRHPPEIRERYGYRDFSDPGAQWRLLRWLYALCWTGTDRPSVLFDQATARLVTHKVLLPGASVVERTIARVRSRANSRLWRLLAARIKPHQKAGNLRKNASVRIEQNGADE